MVYWLQLAALACCCCWSRCLATPTSTEEYVVRVKAAHGTDVAASPDGSALSPFPTIAGARDHLRALRTGGDGRRYRVVVGAGTYAPLELQAQDSGSPGRPVIYEADTTEGPAVVSGGVQVPKTAFQPWAGHPGILKADLASLGVHYGSITAGGDCGGNCTGFAKAGLVFGNRSQVLARWPNVDNVAGKYAWEMVKIGGENGFSVKDSAVVPRMAKWAAEAQPWLHSYSHYDWSDTWNRINISASATEINVTIADHAPAALPLRDAAVTAASDAVSGMWVPEGVWVLKITAQAGKGWSKPTVFCNGSADDIFRILKVKTGGPQDPLHGSCKKYGIDTQNILQISANNGSTWSLATESNSSGPTGVRGALACGNALQKIASVEYGLPCAAIGAQANCTAQVLRCIWQNGHCGPAPPPPPPPPPPPVWWHPFKVGQAKFYGANLLCGKSTGNICSLLCYYDLRSVPDRLLVETCRRVGCTE